MDIINLFKYDNHSHNNAIELGYFWCKEYVKYFCIECYDNKRFVPCKLINKNIIGAEKAAKACTLCEEFIMYPYLGFRYQTCANNGQCNEIWIQCANKCVTKLLFSCAVCDSIIGQECIDKNNYSLCAMCSAHICEACVCKGENIICLNCNEDPLNSD